MSRHWRSTGALPLLVLLLAAGAGRLRAQEFQPTAQGRLSALASFSDRSAGELQGRYYFSPERSVGPWIEGGFQWTARTSNQISPALGGGIWIATQRIRFVFGIEQGVTALPGVRGGTTPGAPAADTLSPRIAAQGVTPIRERTADLLAGAEWRLRGIDFRSTAGWRLAGGRGQGLWVAAQSAVPITSRVALLAGIDQRPRLSQRDQTDRRLSFRLGVELRSHRAVRSRAVDPLVRRLPPAHPASAFQLTRTPDGAVLSFRVPQRVQSVEIRGDMTGWHAQSLHWEGEGVWSIRLTMAPGLHRLSLRCDGGSWQPPAGLPREQTEFNGSVGVLVLPES